MRVLQNYNYHVSSHRILTQFAGFESRDMGLVPYSRHTFPICFYPTVKKIIRRGVRFLLFGIFVPPYDFQPPLRILLFKKVLQKDFGFGDFFVQLRKSPDRGRFQKFKMGFEALIAISSLSYKIESDFDKI